MNDYIELTGAIDLSGAIIRVAMEDYEEALIYKAKGEKTYIRHGKTIYTDSEISQIEKFFKSQWFNTLTLNKINIEAIFEKARKDAKKMIDIEAEIKKADNEHLKKIQDLVKEEIKKRSYKYQPQKREYAGTKKIDIDDAELDEILLKARKKDDGENNA